MDLSYGAFQQVAQPPAVGGPAPKSGSDFSYDAFKTATITPPKATFGQKFMSTLKDVGSALITPPAPKSLDMQESLKAGWDTISSTVKDTATKFENFANLFKAPSTISEKVATTGEADLGIVNNLFLGISAPLNSLRGVPVVGYLADGVNNIFAAIAAGGQDAAQGAVDVSPLSQATKDTIRPLAGDLGALIAQIAAGKAGAEVLPHVADKAKTILNTVHDEIQDVRTKTGAPATETVPKTGEEGSGALSYDQFKASDAAKTAPGEAVTPEIPQITPEAPKPAGEAVSEDKQFKITQVPEKDTLGKETGNQVFRVQQGQSQADFPTEAAAKTFVDSKGGTVISADSIPTVPALKTESTPPETAPKPTPSGLAKSIEQKAIEAKLTKGFENVAGYDSSTIKDQSKLATDLINSGVENARAVVRGERALPDKLRGSSLVLAMEEYLKKNPDPEVAYELANSPLVTAVSEHASELGLMQNREPDSATAKIREIRNAKATPERTKGASNERKTIKVETKKVNLSKDELSWDNFLKKIEC